MRQEHCRVLASGMVGEGHCLLQLDTSPLGQPARAGQFLMVRPSGDMSEALRRPLFFSQGGRLGQLLFALGEPWQRDLAALQPEETLDVLGPLGQPFALRPGVNRLLAIALSEPVAPALAAACWAQRQGVAVSVVLGRPEWNLLADLLPDAVECGVASLGAPAELVESLSWADQAIAVAQEEQLPGLANAVSRARLRLAAGFAQVLVAADYACGVGACGGCARSLGRRQRRLCSEGPSFDLTEVV